MKKYLLTYYGMPQHESREAGDASQARFMDWLAGLGDAVLNPGTPLGPAKKVSASVVTDAGGPDRLTGFTMVRADSIEAAIEMVRTCPFLEYGTMDVAEVFEM